ncbi:MAG: PAS domain-containing protein [Alicyclobacillus macrosporangiidus]|uniref:ATP-binding protein n=1 Tax=Alicyclobacillus macrosporangiidus TaxID=392015 RepID=UPI0026ED12C9|nr:ATP-binding protein [Alicyclobacillus macrosporangiidus]MCL6597773.1 PAS domain-containing protein [Alicyclobacillus macrosporangiidus]
MRVKRRLTNRILPWPLVAAGVVFAIFTVSVTTTLAVSIQYNYQHLTRTLRVLSSIDQMQSSLGEENSALRVFAWNRDAGFLQDLRAAHQVFSDAAQELMRAVSDDSQLSKAAQRAIAAGTGWHEQFAAEAVNNGTLSKGFNPLASEEAFSQFRQLCQEVRTGAETRVREEQAVWWRRVWWTFAGFATAISLLGAGLAWSVAREIRARHRTEQVLRQTYRNLEHAQRVAGIGSWTWDILSNRHTWSDETLRIYGLSEKEFTGTDDAFFRLVHPDDQGHIRDLVRRLQQHGRGEGEFRIVRPDGAERILWWRAEVASDSAGLPTCVVGTVQDITDRKRTEDLLVKSEKLATVGELAVSIAHEIRNPLTTLKGFLQLLPNTPAEAHGQYVSIMLDELSRIEVTLNELLLLARPQKAEYAPVDVAGVIRRAIALLEPLAIHQGVRVITHLTPATPPVWGLAHRMEQALVNVFKNGIEAMPDGGRLAIRLWTSGGHVWVSCTDEGVGMPKERVSKLGEPVYSTKEKGTGLGLVVTYKIVEMHRGRIHVDSTPGHGTTVTICFPESPPPDGQPVPPSQ